MGAGLDEQPDAHDVGQREPPLQAAVRHDADDAADGHRRRQQPEPDFVHAQPLAGVEDQHGPRRAERDVEREDRERQRPHRRMGHEPAEPFDHLRTNTRSLGLELSHAGDDSRDEHRAEREAGGVRCERQRHADREQERTDRRRSSWFVSRKAPCIRALAMPRSVARHEARAAACCWRSRRTSRPCRG